MPSIKLLYFDAAGRGEAIRWAFHMGGVKFEDYRFKFAEWAKYKAKTPFGAAPVLEIDGIIYGQSNAQLRYAGKLSGLYPSDPLLALKVDEFLDAVEEFTVTLTPSIHEKDVEKKLALRKDFTERYVPLYFGQLEKVLERNGSAPFAVGSHITIADLKIVPFLNWLQSGLLDGIPTNVIDPYPRTIALQQATNAHPKIVEWVNAHKKN